MGRGMEVVVPGALKHITNCIMKRRVFLCVTKKTPRDYHQRILWIFMEICFFTCSKISSRTRMDSKPSLNLLFIAFLSFVEILNSSRFGKG